MVFDFIRGGDLYHHMVNSGTNSTTVTLHQRKATDATLAHVRVENPLKSAFATRSPLQELVTRFTEEQACFITSELILAVGYLHQRDIAFR